MDRRNLLTGIGTAAAASTLTAPAIAQGVRELNMVTEWPPNTFNQGVAERLAERINGALNGKVRINVFAAGEFVNAFETFDAVSAGVADMYHSVEYYWFDRSPALAFFAAVPFGLTATEITAWIHHAGGQALWDELSAGFGIKPLLAGNTGVQMGGWFNKELTSVDDYKGLRVRVPGIGGEMLRRLGATVVNLPSGDIVPALQSGAIDAAEWIGPWNDLLLGLHKVAKFYYYPGCHEPGTANSLGINKALWDGLSAEEQQVIETAAIAENSYATTLNAAKNLTGLQTMIKDHGVQLRRFDDSILRAQSKAAAEVLAELASSDPLTGRIHESFVAFRDSMMQWSDLSERAYLNARAL
jgi:TRAP-type mannitol/chloroaromatic compound transport system substrate-binding protein